VSLKEKAAEKNICHTGSSHSAPQEKRLYYPEKPPVRAKKDEVWQL
jgi:hypothetical protein